MVDECYVNSLNFDDRSAHEIAANDDRETVPCFVLGAFRTSGHVSVRVSFSGVKRIPNGTAEIGLNHFLRQQKHIVKSSTTTYSVPNDNRLRNT